jgi:glyoxylase-like metal-dependent hydrolase (beta-lactamase superfamily II)
MRIHLVKTRLVNSYVVAEAGRLLIVDVATRCGRYVLGFVEQDLERDRNDVSLVVCTHDHPDHIGGLRTVARACDAQVGIPWSSLRPHLKWMRNPAGIFFRVVTGFREAMRTRSWNMVANPKRLRRYGRRPSRHPGPDLSFRALRPDYRLVDNQRLAGFPDWCVIHTPGHSWDSICLFHEPSRSLISGDTLLGSSTRGQLVQPSVYDSPASLRRTMQRLKALQPSRVYPGHGAVFAGDELLDHL